MSDSLPQLTIRDRYAHKILTEHHKTFKTLPPPRPTLPTTELRRSGSWDHRPVGIIGAGAAGLYAGMILDTLGIPYEILEASGRVGGRLHTHKFSNEKNDYYDAGAMRYPDIPIMWRTFDLFKRLNFGQNTKIPYTLSGANDVLYYNGFLYKASQTLDVDDPFHVSVKNGGNVPNNYVASGYDALIDAKLGPFKKALAADFEKGWRELMAYDGYSTRAFMSLVEPRYPKEVVDWCETMDTATSLYDCALSESVMDSLDFDWPSNSQVNWWCIQGGGVVIANAMLDRLKFKPVLDKRVQSIHPSEDHMEVVITDESKPRKYSHIISTIPLGCLRMVDTEKCHLHYAIKTAMRTLHYDSSVKVGIKFDKRWWESATQGHLGGEDKGSVLLASYTWAQDAFRFGAFAQGRTTQAEELLIQLVLKDLAIMHGVTLEFLKTSMHDYHVYNWYGSENSCGAFALFGPAQFSGIYEQVTKPAALGKFHFAGEATSVHHAWVVGALNSAFRAVEQVLVVEQDAYLREKLERDWKRPPEVRKETLELQVALGLEMQMK